MCGIIGYIGKQEALPVLLHGLKSMEYRGYDSSGVAVLGNDGQVQLNKAVGKLNNLHDKLAGKKITGRVGCGHQRWATHGKVSEENAHPHGDCAEQIWVVHNGIVENYQELKAELRALGHDFHSETDTEIIAHLIELYKQSGADLETAVRQALRRLRGTYGIIVVDAAEPEKIIAARNFSPLILGIGDGEYFVASDATAILKYTTKVIYLDDGEMAVLSQDGHNIYGLEELAAREKEPQTIDWTADEAQRGGFPTFMLKEICEQPEAVKNSLRGRLIEEDGLAKLGGLTAVEENLAHAKRLLITACGTACLAGRVGEYMIEEYAGLPTEVEIASEFRYRKPIFQKDDVLLAISQSGETADTLAALREAKSKGVTTIGIVNVVGSTLARETKAGIYQHIGPEISVASTKAFVSQVSILALLTLFLGRSRQMSLVTGQRIAKELRLIPSLIEQIIANKNLVDQLAQKYLNYENFFFLGRKYNLPVALEGALKLKELSYVHAEGYGAGELKHGPLAVIDRNVPTIAIASQDSVYEKMLSNIAEVKARDGPVLAIATAGDKKIPGLADDVFYIPKTLEMLTPLLSVIPLQLFAYYFAIRRGRDIDQPRNLAKSVTVE